MCYFNYSYPKNFSCLFIDTEHNQQVSAASPLDTTLELATPKFSPSFLDASLEQVSAVTHSITSLEHSEQNKQVSVISPSCARILQIDKENTVDFPSDTTPVTIDREFLPNSVYVSQEKFPSTSEGPITIVFHEADLLPWLDHQKKHNPISNDMLTGVPLLEKTDSDQTLPENSELVLPQTVTLCTGVHWYRKLIIEYQYLFTN